MDGDQVIKNVLDVYEASSDEEEASNRRDLQSLAMQGPPPLRSKVVDETLQRLRHRSRENSALQEQNAALQAENQELKQPPHTPALVITPAYTNGGKPTEALVVPLMGGRALTYPPGAFAGKLEVGSEILIANGKIIDLVGRHRGHRIAKVSRYKPEDHEVWVEVPGGGGEERDRLQPASWLSADQIKPGAWVYINPDARLVTHLADDPDGQQREQSHSILKQLPVHLTWNQLIVPQATADELADLWDDILYAIQTGEMLNLGIIAEGPPGVGKTQYARTMAVELAKVVGEERVYFEFLSIPGTFSKWFSESERNVTAPFRRARENARLGRESGAPRYTVILIDEFDAFMQPRDLAPNMFPSQITSALLSELDSFESLANTILIAATNRLSWIEGAALRPGRVSRVLSFRRPQNQETLRLFELYLGLAAVGTQDPVTELAERITDYLWASPEIHPLGTIIYRDGSRKAILRTSQLSGALVADACKEAERRARRRGRQGGRGEIGYDDIMHALDTLYQGIVAAMQPHNLANYLETEPAEQLAGVARIEKPQRHG